MLCLLHTAEFSKDQTQRAEISKDRITLKAENGCAWTSDRDAPAQVHPHLLFDHIFPFGQ